MNIIIGTYRTGTHRASLATALSGAAAIGLAVLLVGCMTRVNPPPLYGPPPGPVYYDSNVMKVGTSRAEIHLYFGPPNSTGKTPDGRILDNYAFYEDGTKFKGNLAQPGAPAANAPVIGNPRETHTTGTMTIYHVVYGSDGKVQSVTISPPGVAVFGPMSHPPAAH